MIMLHQHCSAPALFVLNPGNVAVVSYHHYDLEMKENIDSYAVEKVKAATTKFCADLTNYNQNSF